MGGPGWFRANSAAATAALSLFRPPAGVSATTEDPTYVDGDNRLLEVGNTVRIPWADGNDPEADVAALWLHPTTGQPWATITSSDKRLCTSAERGINCAGELEIECERIYRV